MDRYSFEDFVEKPFKYKGKKKEKGLGMNQAVICLLFIYLNGWNSQAVVMKVTATGVWRGVVALTVVTYFFTMPTVMLCLYLGKFLKHGSLSLHKCSPILCGVGVMAFILAFPLSSKMVYFPLAENIIMKWLVEYGAYLPPCSILRETVVTDRSFCCIEEQATYKCCSHPGSTQTGTMPSEFCFQPKYPFYLLNRGVEFACGKINSLFTLSCGYWTIFFSLCMLITSMDIHGIIKILVFVDKFFRINIVLINLLTLLHLEVLLTGFYFYYFEYRVQEALFTTVFDLVVMEVDHLSMGIPFLLMMGRLIDDSVPIDQLAVKLATNKLVQLFWQVNEYIGVISVVATHYKVDYFCLHTVRRSSQLSLGLIPEFLSISITRILKYPVMFSYFLSLFLRKFGSMMLYGNLLTYHLYFWEKKKAKTEHEKLHVKLVNLKGKFIMSVVKIIVYFLLLLCHRIFNLNYSLIPAMDIAGTMILALQLCLISIFLGAIYLKKRFESDVEAVTQRKLWPELLTQLKLQPFICIVFAAIRLSQYYISMDISTDNVSVLNSTAVTSNRLYKLYPIFYIAPAFLISVVYIIYKVVFKFELRVLNVSTDWGPVNQEKWKRIKPFHPGRNLVFYDKFYISHHMCFLDHVRIREVSMQQIENIKLFTRKWPCIFQTLKYKHHKKEIDDLITEAYTWGILASFENP